MRKLGRDECFLSSLRQLVNGRLLSNLFGGVSRFFLIRMRLFYVAPLIDCVLRHDHCVRTKQAHVVNSTEYLIANALDFRWIRQVAFRDSTLMRIGDIQNTLLRAQRESSVLDGNTLAKRTHVQCRHTSLASVCVVVRTPQAGVVQFAIKDGIPRVGDIDVIRLTRFECQPHTVLEAEIYNSDSMAGLVTLVA